jgi:hypothetical protein
MCFFCFFPREFLTSLKFKLGSIFQEIIFESTSFSFFFLIAFYIIIIFWVSKFMKRPCTKFNFCFLINLILMFFYCQQSTSHFSYTVFFCRAGGDLAFAFAIWRVLYQWPECFIVLFSKELDYFNN